MPFASLAELTSSSVSLKVPSLLHELELIGVDFGDNGHGRVGRRAFVGRREHFDRHAVHRQRAGQIASASAGLTFVEGVVFGRRPRASK